MFKVKKNKQFFKILFLFLLTVVFLVSLITLPFINKIYPNVYIAGVYLGDKNKDEALVKLKKVTLPEKVSLVLKGEEKSFLTSEIVKDVDYQKTIDRAYNLTNTGNFLFDLLNKIKIIISPINMGLAINFDDQKIDETLLILSSKEVTKPIKPSAKISGNVVVIDPGKNGSTLNSDKVTQEIKNELIFNKSNKINVELEETKDALSESEALSYKETLQKLVGKNIDLVLDFDTITITDKDLILFINPRGGYNEENIKNKIVEISRKVNSNPQDSVFIVENGNVTEFTPSKDGVTVNEDKLVEEIKNYLVKLINESEKSYSFEIPIIKYPAKIRNEDVNDLGINTLLGKGVSHFAGSIPNRIHNVNLAQSKFRGILVPPDEIFSFNNVLGDVSSYTGYKAAYVIKDGKTVLGDGGGVCQVSTTLFRAILSAGLPIVERRPHSYRVGYYEQGFGPGLDATVYYPTTDLKFKNDTGAYLLIQPTIDNPNYTLTFEIYGTDDGRVSTVSKPVITSSVAPAPDLYVDDPTLKAGVIKQIEHRAYGARVVFDYKVERNGEVLIDQKFVSTYRPWQAVYLRGTATQ